MQTHSHRSKPLSSRIGFLLIALLFALLPQHTVKADVGRIAILFVGTSNTAGQLTNPATPSTPFPDTMRYRVLSLLKARGCSVTSIGPRHAVQWGQPGALLYDMTSDPFGFGVEGWTTQHYINRLDEITSYLNVRNPYAEPDADEAYPAPYDKIVVVLSTSVNDVNPTIGITPSQSVSNMVRLMNEFLKFSYVSVYVVDDLAANRGTKSCPNCGTYPPSLDVMRAEQITRKGLIDAAISPLIAANPARAFRVNTLEATATSTTNPPALGPNGRTYTFVALNPNRGSFTHGSGWPEHQLWADAIVQGLTQNRPGCGVGVTDASVPPEPRNRRTDPPTP